MLERIDLLVALEKLLFELWEARQMQVWKSEGSNDQKEESMKERGQGTCAGVGGKDDCGRRTKRQRDRSGLVISRRDR